MIPRLFTLLQTRSISSSQFGTVPFQTIGRVVEPLDLFEPLQPLQPFQQKINITPIHDMYPTSTPTVDPTPPYGPLSLENTSVRYFSLQVPQTHLDNVKFVIDSVHRQNNPKNPRNPNVNWRFHHSSKSNPFHNVPRRSFSTWSTATGLAAPSFAQRWAMLPLIKKVLGIGGVLAFGAIVAENARVAGSHDNPMGPNARALFRETYMYTLLGTGLSLAVGVFAWRTGLTARYMSFAMRSPILSMFAVIAPFMASSFALSMTPNNNPVLKHVFATCVYGSLGFSGSTLGVLGGPILIEAATLTAGIFAALSGAAILSPSDAFVDWGAPLAMTFGVMALASFLPLIMPRVGIVKRSSPLIYNTLLYGGLALSGGFLLYHTKNIQNQCKAAEYSPERFSPVEASVRVFVSLYNIFSRLAIILAQSSGNRRK